MTNKSVRILIVDDERPIRRFLRTALETRYDIIEAAAGTEALHEVAYNRPDLVILDLGLPDIDGVEVTRRLREWSQVPIIIVSVREQEEDKIEALDAGADDYLTKPFGAGELLARIRVILRRVAQPEPGPIYTIGDLVVDFANHLVKVRGQEVSLTPTEYDILKTLAHHAGKVLTHRFMLRNVWGQEYEEDTQVLRVNVSNLRRKIELDPGRPQLIITEPGVGYRLKVK